VITLNPRILPVKTLISYVPRAIETHFKPWKKKKKCSALCTLGTRDAIKTNTTQKKNRSKQGCECHMAGTQSRENVENTVIKNKVVCVV
jgi:hypothetical protein